MRKFYLWFICLLPAVAFGEGKYILVSVPPLAIIAKEICGEDVRIESLITGAVSPHHASLRPSDIRRINRADQIFWVGPSFEHYLVRALRGKPHVALMSRLSLPKIDPHIWLNVKLAERIAREMAKACETPFNEQSAVQQQLIQFEQSLITLDAALQKTLAGQNAPFLVFHDSLSHWVERYGLPQIASLTQTPEEPVGLKSLSTLLKRSKQAECLLTEPGEKHEAQKYAKRLALPLTTIDILATEQTHPTFAAFMHHLANSVTQCGR